MLALHQADDLSRVYSACRTMVAGIGSKPRPPTAHQFDLIWFLMMLVLRMVCFHSMTVAV